MLKSQLIAILKLIGLLCFLYLLITGIGAMGHSFELFGREFSERMLNTTASLLVGLFIGILATSLQKGTDRRV